MTVTMWFCEHCKINNHILDNRCTKCGRTYLDAKTIKRNVCDFDDEKTCLYNGYCKECPVAGG